MQLLVPLEHVYTSSTPSPPNLLMLQVELRCFQTQALCHLAWKLSRQIQVNCLHKGQGLLSGALSDQDPGILAMQYPHGAVWQDLMLATT